MLQHALTVYKFLDGYERKLLADLGNEAMSEPAFPGGNPPAWIVGHLALASDFALGILGQPALCPKTWLVMFGPGSDPAKHRERHPTKAALVAALERGHAAVVAAVPNFDPAKLAEPSPFEPLRHVLPTAGDLLIHLMTSHESFHVSQLSACRRARGLGPVF